MSKVEFVEIGGHRYTAAEIDAHRIEEFRCETCGQFIAEGRMVIVAAAELVQEGAPIVYVPTLYFDVAHVPSVLVPFLTEGR